MSYVGEESGDGSGWQGLSVIFRTALITRTKRENGGSRIMLHHCSGEEPGRTTRKCNGPSSG